MAVVPTRSPSTSTPSPTTARASVGIEPQKKLMSSNAVVDSSASDATREVATTEQQEKERNVPKMRKTPSMDSASAAEESANSSLEGTSASAKQRKYERKTKRFIWPDELHRLFVAAIFDVGLKNASPKALLSVSLLLFFSRFKNEKKN
jgi:hypothetical protein